MKVLILNFILSTPINGKIIRRDSNHDTMIYNMARGFVRAGHEVTLLASEEYKPILPEINDFNVIYFKSALPWLLKPYLLPSPIGLKRYLQENAPYVDLVLAVETFSIPTLIASRACPQKMLIWQEVGTYQRFAFRLPAKFWCHVVARTFMRNIPLVAMSENARTFTRQFMDNVSEKLVAHGADEEKFHPNDGSFGDYFVIVSMLVARKRVDTMIQKFANFVSRYPTSSTKLKIIGEGPEEKSLKTLVEKLGIASRVDFLGFRKHHEMVKIEREAIALLVNTGSDLNMVSVTEAIANGTPILMNTVANTAKYVHDLKLGIAKDNWDETDLMQMKLSRDKFHSNCVAYHYKFSNTGVAKALSKIFFNSKL